MHVLMQRDDDKEFVQRKALSALAGSLTKDGEGGVVPCL